MSDNRAPSNDSAISNNRPTWQSSNTFILAVAGAAIGISNFTLFPIQVATYGGSAFVLLYMACVVIIGLPVLMMEIAIGKYTAANPVTAIEQLAKQEKHALQWAYIGWAKVFACLMILSFFSVIVSWSIAYMFRMLGNRFVDMTPAEVGAVFNSIVTDPEKILAWHTLFILVIASIVAKGLRAGIEKTIRLVMPVFFFILVAILLLALFSGVFFEAVSLLLNFNVEQLFTLDAALAAFSMAFFSIALGRGAVMTYSSYLPQNTPILRASLNVILIDLIVIIFAALAVFPLVIASGQEIMGEANLIFQVLPAAIAENSFGRLIGFLFYLMMLLAALTSAIALLEPAVATFIERRQAKRAQVTWRCAITVWLLGLGTLFSFNIWSNYTWTLQADFDQLQILLFKNQSFFNVIEVVSSKLIVPLSALLLVVFIGHLMRRGNLEKLLGLPKKIFSVWYFMIHYVTPFALFLILLNAMGFFGI